ncbi:MAG: hypothetical protein JRN57_04930, partial [Nitrososphaerota archaeon]|nr:hypothetical protein [Nitrososphaerota archaeon]
GSPLSLKPLLQILFEQLYDFGFRDFCFVVGRAKRAIEDHFTEDPSFLNYLTEKGKSQLAEDLGSFYRKVGDSAIVWVNQGEPGGFGDAVLKSKGFVDGEDFFVAAGDTVVLTPRGKSDYLGRLLEAHEKRASSATFAAMNVPDPENYGIVRTSKKDSARVLSVEEKPKKPRRNLAIMPFYVFKPEIFDALETVKEGAGGELQLTDAIGELLRRGRTVSAVPLFATEKRLDIGTPETYWDAISQSYELARKHRQSRD